MKPWRLWLIVMVVLVAAFLAWPGRPKTFSVGPPLPPGRVKPQLVGFGNHALLLAPDGSLWSWGDEWAPSADSRAGSVVRRIYRPQRLGLESDWTKIAAGSHFWVALKTDGSLWRWGVIGPWQNANSSANGTLPPTRIGAETNWIEASAGAGHCMALKRDGSLWAWGMNAHGQVGDGTKRNKLLPTRITGEFDWRTISVGAFNSFALKTNGTIWGWGLDPTSGPADDLAPAQLDPRTNWAAIAAGDFHLLALQLDGTLWIRGQNARITASDFARGRTIGFVQIGQERDWQEIYSGQNYFLARKKDGSWWACGQNGSGQLGLGHTLPREAGSPKRLPIEFDPWAFAAGSSTTVLLAKDGKVWTWGTQLSSSQRAPPWRRSKEIMSRLVSIVSRKSQVFRFDELPVDLVPRNIWELPLQMKETLHGVGEPGNSPKK